MPFTPFHWGPVLLVGLLFFSILDLPALLVSSVIVDIEPLYFMLKFSNPYHGFFHSYLGSSIMGTLIALGMFAIRNYTKNIMKVFKLEQSSSFCKILTTSLFGVYSHVFLDSFLYPEMKPFFPSDIKPFYGLLSPGMIYGFCMISFFIALILYTNRIIRSKE